MRTSCIVTFGKNALTIGEDASIALLFGVDGGLQAFGDLSTVANGTSNTLPFATYEPNFWLLDGNYKFAPSTNGRAGWISTDMSGSGGGFDFGSPKPGIQIDFDDVHSTDGITLTFSEHSGDYADSVRVAFYNSAFSVIDDDTYTPTSTSFFTNNPIANFKRIIIEINSTNRAQRYARLTRIDFDEVVRFSGEEIKAAKVIEEINPLSTEIPANTIDLELFSSDGDFSITDPAGFYATLQYKEPLDVHEDINGYMMYIGRFYLDEWRSKSENLAEFKALDAISLLDKTDFFVTLFFDAYRYSQDIIEDIMDQAGFDYELDASLNNINVASTVAIVFPVVSCREVLQNVLFAIGAYATCSRSNIIQIKPFELAEDLVTYDHTLTASDVGISSSIDLKPLVTGVRVTTHDHSAFNPAVPEKMADATLTTGNHNVVYDRAGFGGSTGTAVYSVTKDGAWYLQINVSSAGTFVYEFSVLYPETTTIVSYDGSFPAGTPASLKVITDAFTVRPYNAADIAERVFDYYSQRYLQKIRLFGALIAPGDSILVDVQSNKQLKGIIERIETDLARGCVSNVEVTGVII